MLKISIKYIFIILILFLLSCKDKNKFIIQLIPIDTLNFKRINSDQTFTQYYYDKETNQGYLTFSLDNRINYIRINDTIYHLFSLNNKLKIYNNISGYYIKNFDSFFILFNNKVFLFNKQQLVIDSITIHPYISDKWDYSLISSVNFPLFYQDNKLFTFILPYTEPLSKDEKTRNIFYSINCEMVYDISKKPIIYNNKIGSFPKIFRSNKNYYTFYPDRIINKNNQIIYSYPILSKLYVYKLDGSYKTYNIKSIYFKDKEITEFKLNNFMNYNYIRKYLSTEPRFGRLIYDNYRNLIYRVVMHSQKFKNKDGTINLWIDKPWSLLIIDSNFKIIGEVNYPAKKFDFTNILVIKEGLLISNDNKLNPLYNSKKISYTLFKPQVKL